jgi:hypothetical protein
MKKNLKWLGLGGVLATAMLFVMDLPAMGSSSGSPALTTDYDDLMKSCLSTAKKDCNSWAREGGGSEAPRGLSTDTRVELANGEKYILSGTIEANGTNLYLHINLHQFPWLASHTRVANPFYRIDDAAGAWTKYLGKNVTILATAKYTVFSQGGRTLFEIALTPADQPVIDALQYNQK